MYPLGDMNRSVPLFSDQRKMLFRGMSENSRWPPVSSATQTGPSVQVKPLAMTSILASESTIASSAGSSFSTRPSVVGDLAKQRQVVVSSRAIERVTWRMFLSAESLRQVGNSPGTFALLMTSLASTPHTAVARGNCKGRSNQTAASIVLGRRLQMFLQPATRAEN